MSPFVTHTNDELLSGSIELSTVLFCYSNEPIILHFFTPLSISGLPYSVRCHLLQSRPDTSDLEISPICQFFLLLKVFRYGLRTLVLLCNNFCIGKSLISSLIYMINSQTYVSTTNIYLSIRLHVSTC